MLDIEEKIYIILKNSVLVVQEYLSKRFGSIVRAINHNKNLIINLQAPYFYSSQLDKERDRNFLIFFKNPDIEDLYRKLIKNLDEKSIKIVNSIIATYQRLNTTGEEYIDIFTDEEKQIIKNINKDFRSNVVKLNNNCYSWNNYYLPIDRFISNIFYFNYQLDDINNLERVREKNILDVGGYIGDSAILLASYTDKNVHVFEPIKRYFNLILKTIELNNSKNIIPYNFGLGDKSETVDIQIEGGSSSMVLPKQFEQNNGVEHVTTRTLDEFIAENPMEIGLIKVDIEGFEQPFLRGAKQTICTQKPTLLISIYHSVEDFFEIKPMIESWNLGYKFKIRRPIDGAIHSETLLIAEII